jgi:hypothetical protein
MSKSCAFCYAFGAPSRAAEAFRYLEIMNKKNIRRKKRKEVITATTVDNTTSITISFDPQTNSLVIHEADPKTVKSNISYDRASGKEKYLNISPSGKESVSFNPTTNLINNFDHLCAIDTNTKIINSRKISITVVYHVPELLKLHANKIPYVYLCSYLIADVKETINPEIIGWHLFFKHKIQSNYFQNGRRLALVVDCQLDNHDKINSRNYPYYKEHILPPYATLVYASSDTGTEYLPNKMLAFSDKASNQLLKYFEDNVKNMPKLSPGDENYYGFCELRGINKDR